MNGRVYLAGPITGLTYGGATDWREAAELFLHQYGVEALSPMRGKKYLEKEKVIADEYAGQADWPLSMAAGFTSRDRSDCMNADIVLANFEGAEKVSIGTVMECAWADAFRTQLIVVMDEDNVHNHAMVRQVSAYRVGTLAQGLALVPPILNAVPVNDRIEPLSFEECANLIAARPVQE